MVRDRLPELREIRKRNNLSSDDNVLIILDENETQKKLLDILDEIGPLYAKLEGMSSSVEELRSLVHQHQHRDQIEDQVARVKSQARKLREALKVLKDKGEGKEGVVEHVIRVHHLSLCTKLTLTLHDLTDIQAQAHQRHAQYVKKELIITGQAGYSEEELENLLEEPPDLFTEDLIKQTQMARQQLSDLRERHADFMKLEKSIQELCTLFNEVQMLVAEQGASINRIENNVFESQTRTEKARTELKEARVNQAKALKKKFILGIIVTVVLLIIILTIIFSVCEC